MKIILAEHAGFCFGVKRAAEQAIRLAKEGETLYTLGELIHNRRFIEYLSTLGIHTVHSVREIPPGGHALIRSHGVGEAVYRDLEARGLSYTDLTCPFVARIHRKVAAEKENFSAIVIVGREEHPEVVGIKGWAGEHAYVVSSAEEAAALPFMESVLVVAQTTITRRLFTEACRAIGKRAGHVELFDSICETTAERQDETAKLAALSDAVLVIGDPQSSNSKNLEQIAKRYCKNVDFVESAAQLILEKYVNYDIISIVAGASAPDRIIREVRTRMSELEKAQVTEETGLTEEAKEAAATVTDTAPEVAVEDAAATVTDTAPEVAVEDAAATVTDTAPEVAAEDAAVTVTDAAPEVAAEDTAVTVTDAAPEVAAEDAAVTVTDAAPEVAAEDAAVTVTDAAPEVAAEDTAVTVTDAAPEVAAEDTAVTVTDTAPEVVVEEAAATPEEASEEAVAAPAVAPEAVAQEAAAVTEQALAAQQEAGSEEVPAAPQAPEPAAAQAAEASVAEPAPRAEAEESAQAPKKPVSEATFAEEMEKTFVKLKRGQFVKGVVVQVTDSEICVNIGYKSDGILRKEDMTISGDVAPSDMFKPGDEIEAEILTLNDGEGNVLLSRKKVEKQQRWKSFVDALDKDAMYECMITRVIKGGVLTKFNGYDAFIPASQLTLHYVEDLNTFVGKNVLVKILDVDMRQKRFVLSNKAALKQQAAEGEKLLFQSFEKGSVVRGTVKRLTDFGAFVDVGGVDGLLHITDISWVRIKHPSDVLHENQEIDVKILNIDPERRRISLGYKQLQPRPWDLVPEKYHAGDIIEGKVVRIAPFGAFVELEPTVDGLIHISQVTNRRIDKVEDILSLGQVVKAKVLEVNADRRRISLSIRATMEPEKRPAEEERESKPRFSGRHEERERSSYSLPPVEEATTSLADLFRQADENDE